MKITINKLVESVPDLKAILATKLPIKVAYRINKLVNNQIERELKQYDEARISLVNKYGDKDEKGDLKVTDPEKIKEFMKELNELLAMEIELDFTPIKVEELGDVQVEPKSLVSFLFE